MSGHTRPMTYAEAYSELSEVVEDMFAATGEQRAELRQLVRLSAKPYRAALDRCNRDYFRALWRQAWMETRA